MRGVQFCDRKGIVAREKMLLCDGKQRSRAIGVTVKTGIGNWE
ncbi:hypothetical protein [Microcoleus sp. herbarium12]